MALSSSTSETIAITGSSGFIGSHLLQHFKQEKISFTAFKGELTNPASVKDFFKVNTVKQIVHLAGTFYGPFEQLVNKNVITTQKLIEAALEFGVDKIIYASTGAVYGEPIEEVSIESDACNPNTLYGLSKKMAEEVILYYHLAKGLKYVILRFPNVYGEGNTKGVLYNFLKDIQQSGSITIAGDGSQSRNFLHVSDACTAIIKSIGYNRNEIFNISSSPKISINDVVAALKQHYSFEVKFKEPDNFLKNLLLDASKAASRLEFKAQVNDLSAYIQNFKMEKQDEQH